MPRTISTERNEARSARPLGWGRETRDGSSHLPRAPVTHPQSAGAALAFASLALLAPSYAAAESEDVAELRRTLRELQAQNRELSRRLSALESTREAPMPPRTKPARPQERPPPPTDISPLWLSSAAASARAATPLPEPRDTTGMGLDERVKELEVAWAAQEYATRQIIRDTLAKNGPKINSFLSLSGVIEVGASRTRDFDNPYSPYKDTLALSTVELDFDVRLSNWLTGALVATFESGVRTTFPDTAPGVDRFSLDRTHILIGDFTLFPIAARAGRETLHFGTSTGVARLDTLSIGTPLTTEVFENRQTTAGLEFAFPTPPLKPPPTPVTVPPVRPLVISPAVSSFMRALDYKPLPERVLKLTPVSPPIVPSPFYGSFMVYRGSELIVPDRTHIHNFNASLGFRTQGHCGETYEELRTSLVCPWTFDFHVDYNTSVFDSRFLVLTYTPFLDQIGLIPGVAASVKASFGPFAFVGEVNSATKPARFFDAFGTQTDIQPISWQLALAYQFDWNPWVTEIGAQGDFISVVYTGSKDMAGVTNLLNGVPTRIGFVPQNAIYATWGEWVMEGLKLALEYQAKWDYPQSQGGTGRLAHGAFGLVQLNF
jgi:uncharacterized coiled-coil protein SlyX